MYNSLHGSRNIKIKIGGASALAIKNRSYSYRSYYSCHVPAIKCIALSSLRSVGVDREWQQVTGKLLSLGGTIFSKLVAGTLSRKRDKFEGTTTIELQA